MGYRDSNNIDLKVLMTMDLYTSAVINRSLALIKGYRALANSNNFISAVPLIRLQVDNCLRYYAAIVSINHDIFFQEFMAGKHIKDMLDYEGHKMSDNYLAKKLDKKYSGILNLYRNTSGYIHLSNEHSLLQTTPISSGPNKIRMEIGNFDFFKLDQKVDFNFNMLRSSEILFELVKSWKYQKAKLITENNT